MTGTPLTILQWNARSLVANGQEFKKFVYDLPVLPDVLCIQETWLVPHLQFVVPGYTSVRKDRREGHGGGCCTFVKEGLPYRELIVGDSECVAVEMWWTRGDSVIIVNFYNPCNDLTVEYLERVVQREGKRVVWCGDFNAHNSLWGCDVTNRNGEVLEEFMDNETLVCLNDGRGTRVNVRTGALSALDLTCVSSTLAGLSEWDILEHSTIGSDHFPLICKIAVEVNREVNWCPGKWHWKEADWELFNEVCETRVGQVQITGEVNDMARSLSDVFLTATAAAVPRSQGRGRRKIVPWWTKECTEAIQTRNKAFRVLRITLTPEKVVEYQKARAKARKVIKDAKRKCWREYCSQLGTYVQIEQVWGMVKKMMGVFRGRSIPVLVEGNSVASSAKDKAELLKTAFAKAHSTDNLEEPLVERRQATLREWGNVCERQTDCNSIMDRDITLFELKCALINTSNTAPGQDEVCYIMLKHVSDEVLKKVVEVFNRIWSEGKVPDVWKHSLVIPIAKPGKDPSKAASYRPIALTSNMCKLMERILVNRLTYFMESKGLFAGYQSGFRKGRSTLDAMIRLETDIRKALAMKEVLVAVFFDIEKAYDMLWKEGLMIQLKKLGVGGRLFNWILSFLFGRTIQVRVGADVSTVTEVQNGTPQGSVISPVLFNIMVNEVFRRVSPDIEVSLYADDGALWRRGRNINFIVSKIQQAIEAVVGWAGDWGFRFSVAKTYCEFFTKRTVADNVKLYMYGEPLERVEVARYLGLWFDRRLTWKAHIDKLETKCKRVLNVMRCLTGMEWGASRSSLMTLYYALLRSAIDYGSFVYGSASDSRLMKLERIQSRALRLCCGALQSSPIVSLHVELGEMPLAIRRKKLSLAYWSNLEGHNQGNPAKRVIEPCWEYEAKKGKGFGWRVREWVQEAGLKEGMVSPTVAMSPVPPWLFPMPIVDMSILKYAQEEQEKQYVAGYALHHIGCTYARPVQIYTDGSKDPESGKTAAAMVVKGMGVCASWRLTDEVSVYTTELIAIIKALEWVEETGQEEGLICSDSAAVLGSIQSFRSCRMDLLNEVYLCLYRLEQRGASVSFLWIPAHVGIWGNEKADGLAKKALENPEPQVNTKLGRGEVKVFIRRALTEQWQIQWNTSPKGRHMYAIHREVGREARVGGCRRDEVVVARLRIGHTLLNSTQCRVGRTETGDCMWCPGQDETVEHVWLVCPTYQSHREHWKEQLQSAGCSDFNLAAVLGDGIRPGELIRFVKRAGLYERI